MVAEHLLDEAALGVSGEERSPLVEKLRNWLTDGGGRLLLAKAMRVLDWWRSLTAACSAVSAARERVRSRVVIVMGNWVKELVQV